MTARELPLERLVGHGVRLDPITADAQLRELATVLRRPETFASGYAGGLAALPADDEAFVDFMRGFLPGFRGGRSFLVRRDDEDGQAIGTTSFGNVDPIREVVEIGWTAYAPEAWGTTVNPACKLLLLETAFGHGYGKVVLNVDAINERSLRAVARLGAVREGVLRRDRPRPDGTWRDTVTHSILASELPAVRAGLRARLET